jgi:hypothetical protein
MSYLRPRTRGITGALDGRTDGGRGDADPQGSGRQLGFEEGEIDQEGGLRRRSTQSGWIAVGLRCIFKPKQSPYLFDIPAKWYKTKGNWSLNFQLAPAHTVASGEYKPPELNSVTLGAGTSNYSPNIADFGSVDLKSVSLKKGGALGGTVKIDDGYFTVNTTFKGKVAKVYPPTPSS